MTINSSNFIIATEKSYIIRMVYDENDIDLPLNLIKMESFHEQLVDRIDLKIASVEYDKYIPLTEEQLKLLEENKLTLNKNESIVERSGTKYKKTIECEEISSDIEYIRKKSKEKTEEKYGTVAIPTKRDFDYPDNYYECRRAICYMPAELMKKLHMNEARVIWQVPEYIGYSTFIGHLCLVSKDNDPSNFDYSNIELRFVCKGLEQRYDRFTNKLWTRVQVDGMKNFVAFLENADFEPIKRNMIKLIQNERI